MSGLLDQLEALDAALRGGAPQAETLDAFAGLHDETIAAIQAAPPAAALRLVGAASRYWWMRGHARLGAALAAQALSAAPEAPDAVWAHARHGAGDLARAQGDYAGAIAHYRDAVARWRAALAPVRAALVQDAIGIACRELGRLDEAHTHHTEALRVLRGAREPAAAALAAHNLAVVSARRGDYRAAAAGHREALAARRAIGDDLGIASSLNNLGVLALLSDREPARAEALLAEALRVREGLGDAWGAAASRVCLGWCLIPADPVRARGLLREGLRGFVAVGDRLGVAESLEAFAALERDGDLLATAEASREALGLPTPKVRLALYEEVFAGLEGRARPVEGAVRALLGS